MAEIVDQLSAGLKIESDEELEEKEDDSCTREMKVTKLSQLLSELLETERKYVQDSEQVLYSLFKMVLQLCVAGL
jgi:hypothetical protein